MADVELIAVPFDGYGRAGHQAAAAEALRGSGLPAALGPYRVVESEPLALPEGTGERGADTSLVNEPALVAMSEQVGERVAAAVTAGRFPVVYGGDCTTLLGIIPALRADGRVGLLFFDGHEDTMPLDVSEDGEAANTEIGLLLGLTGRLLRGPLAARLPALGLEELAMLGPRDAGWRRQFNVASLRDLGVWMRDWHEVDADPEGSGARAAAHLQRHTARWWLHIDLDVLDPEEFPAQGFPDIPDEPGGLTWQQLTSAATGALREGGCIGCSVAIYDPDQDGDRAGAGRICDFIAEVIATRSPGRDQRR
ncbi:arginase family protein [Allonocardiopsis opalescens]|uniref:Arginase n=1 Tax=Allonocardiopsis opalescens TaxID=1144618 RepID=A0A2T0PYK4_9ACTN|nr:arginase family protein [Allonocardiopsis opalescens]PRX96539.1 arginase [Allonocardiopsis opalescens]